MGWKPRNLSSPLWAFGLNNNREPLRVPPFLIAVSEFRVHAMAEIQGSWLIRVWLVARTLVQYIVRVSPFSHLSYKLFYHTFSLGYEPGSQGIFIEKAFYYIVYSYDRLPRTTTSLPPAKVGTTKCNVALLVTTMIINHQPATSNQMLLDTIQ